MINPNSLHIVLTRLKSRGAVFSVNGDRLNVRAPKGVVSSDIRAYLAEHRNGVISCFENERIVREWLSRLMNEFTFPLDLPPEFEGRFEEMVVSFIDGLIPFSELDLAWTRFVAESHAEREIVEDDL